jgi:hypothetical protein
MTTTTTSNTATNSIKILTQKQAIQTISLIKSGGKKLDDRIHQVGVSGLSHYLDNGDLTALSNLCHAMPKSGRGNALNYWVTRFANVTWNKKAYAGKGGFVKIKSAEERVADVQGAMNSPFWEKTDTEQAAFNAESRVKSFINAFKKAVADGKISYEEWEKAKEAIKAA